MFHGLWGLRAEDIPPFVEDEDTPRVQPETTSRLWDRHSNQPSLRGSNNGT